MSDRGFSPTYCLPHASLHLYFYNATMRLDGTIYHLSPGDMTITPVNSKSAYNLPAPGMHYFVHFSPSEGSDDILPLPCYIPNSQRSRNAAAYLEDIIELKRFDSELTGQAANETFRLLLLHLALGLGLQHDSATKLGRKLENACSIIEETLDNEINTAKLAARLNLSPNYLAKSFQNRYGTTIKGYQLQKRIERAAFLLDFSNLSIKEAGAMVGMPDPQYFNKRFRSVKGMSPTGYRNRAR